MNFPGPKSAPYSALTAIAAAALTLALLGLQTLGSPLYWWHVAVGELIATWQRIPDQQLFLFTVAHDEPAVYSSWLGALVLAAIHAIAGPELNLLIRNLLCAGSVGLVSFFVARRTDRRLANLAPLALIGGACFFFAPPGPAALALPLATVAILAIFALLEHPQRPWLAAVAPLVVLLIVNVDLATALVVVAASTAAAFHLARRHTYPAAALAAGALPALFAFAYGPRFWLLAATSLQWASLVAPAAVLIALFAASRLAHRGRPMPSPIVLSAAIILPLGAATALQPGVPTRPPILTALHADVRDTPPLAGVLSADLPLRCAEHLRRTGRQLRLFHAPEYAGFLLYHLVDPAMPHASLFDDHRHLLDDQTRATAQLIRHEPVARGLLPQLGVNAAVFHRQAYPILHDELASAPDWHDLAEGIDHFACFVPR